MEALGEVQETADFFNVYCDDFERQQGFDHALPNDPLPNAVSRNRSVMKPYGVWVVINPFNFPFALAGGPVAAALVTGNTVVLKGASETPWAGRMLADCLRDAGLPPGVFNYLMGPGGAIGDALVQDPRTAGVTFTGSYETGMHIIRTLANGKYPRPCIAEMGGKNAGIVTAGGGSGTRGDGHRAQRLRHGRAEVLGVVATVRAGVGGRRADRARRQEGRGARRRRSDARGELARTGGQREGAAQLPVVHRAAAQRGRQHPLRRTRTAGRRSARAVLCAADARRGAGRRSAVARGDVPADRHAAADPRPGRRHRARERFRARADRRLLRLAAGSRAVFPGHRSGRNLCEPRAGRDHRRLAGLSAVRRLEGLGQHRQGDRVVLLSRAVHARAVADSSWSRTP